MDYNYHFIIFINNSYPFNLSGAIKLATYCIIPLILSSLIMTTKLHQYFKTGIILILFTSYYGVNYIVHKTLYIKVESYKVNLLDWKNYSNGNILLLYLLGCIISGIIFLILGMRKKIAK